jgi:hypothetical protein
MSEPDRTEIPDVNGLDVSELSAAVADLVRVVEQLRIERDEDRALIDELLAELAHQGMRKPRQPPVFENWQQWVDEWLVVRVSRHPHRYRWCHSYAEHAEVADRLEALWHAWEAQWPDPLGRLTWFRDGLDHHLAVITAEDGPLRGCSALEGEHAAIATGLNPSGSAWTSSESSMDRVVPPMEPGYGWITS